MIWGGHVSDLDGRNVVVLASHSPDTVFDML